MTDSSPLSDALNARLDTSIANLRKASETLEALREERDEAIKDRDSKAAKLRFASSQWEEGRKLNERLQEKLETATRDLADRASERDLARAAVDESTADLKRLRAERDAIALRLEVATRDLECRTSERDRAIVERDDARRCNFRLQREVEELRGGLEGAVEERDEAHAFASSLHAERDDLTIECRELRARLRTYAARPSSSDDGVAPLAADPCADAFGEGLTENTVQTSARDLEPAVSSRAAASPESAGPEVVSRLKTVSESLDLEARVTKLEENLAKSTLHAADMRGELGERLANLASRVVALEPRRTVAERSEAAKPPVGVMKVTEPEPPTDWGVDMR